MTSDHETPKRQQAGALQTTRSRNAIWFAAVVLFVLHQDFWWWDDRTLLFGFMPAGLAYHMLYSILAGSLWALTVKFAWPSHVEEFAKGKDR
jgi:hypothetical protein